MIRGKKRGAGWWRWWEAAGKAVGVRGGNREEEQTGAGVCG